MTLQIRWTKTCVDLTGMTFGRLTVRELIGRRGKQGVLAWLCDCECGGTCEVVTADLKKGIQKSCGCYIREVSAKRLMTHGLGHSREYRIWGLMISRCTDPDNIGWRHYGGKGIHVCQRWLDSVSNFVEDMGPRPSPQHSIDRLDSTKDYSPDNCRWATKKEQSRNTSRNRFIEFDGQTLTLAEWSERTGIPRWKISRSISSGLSVADALSIRPKSLKLRRN